MKLLIKTFLFLIISFIARAQDSTIIISPNGSNEIGLSENYGWIFRKGHDTAWSRISINTESWDKLNLSEITEKYADSNGRLEGWQRAKIKLDTALNNTPLNLHYYTWGAAEIYVDGKLFSTYGSTGANGTPYKAFNPIHKVPFPLNMQVGTEHIIAIHFVDYLSPFPPHKLKTEHSSQLKLWLPKLTSENTQHYREEPIYVAVWLSVSITLSLLFWLLAFQNPRERNLWLVAICATGYTIFTFVDDIDHNPNVSYFVWKGIEYVEISTLAIVWTLTFILIANVFNRKITRIYKIIFVFVFISGILSMFVNNVIISGIFNFSTLIIYGWYIITSWKSLKGAQWAIVGSMILPSILYAILFIARWINPSLKFSITMLLVTGITLSIPLSLLVYVSIRFKEIIREVRENGMKVLQLSEEKKEKAIQQQKILEEEVARQTAELRTSFENLKTTQAQLIQSAKMASLGELTAGIAHEIQNPLNFVNNFSEVNSELIEEMKTELKTGNNEDAIAIANDIADNEQKINHHGKRADAIVKGMLQHSRRSSAVKEPTDINKLTDEYLRLAYHGLRAKDKSFNATMKTDFDESIGNINVIPQDIGRVLLNLYNNAFYAASLPSKGGFPNSDKIHDPTIWVSTKKVGDKVCISVKDNGPGIPQKVVDKIFQPFFTTKPTGQGTGLGLSLAYDIVKAHGGEIQVESKEGEGATFIIEIPFS